MESQGKDRFLGGRIREYEILDVIGRGGMGAVYRARHVYLEEERAIKVVQSQFTRDAEFMDRFIREAKILARMQHPNLVQLYEFGPLDEESFFMVMEFIRGESLLARVKRLGRIPVDQAVKIIREAALGLGEAHQKGVVHRDISPDNLLIVQKGEEEIVKVIDFGIAKPLEEQTKIFTRTNMFVGKPEFCSPEQCGMLSEGETIDHRSDIYSLGVTFYLILAGTLPFYSPNPQGYLLKHIQEVPQPVSYHFPPGEISRELDRIVAKLLNKKRDERYSTMQELVEDLDQMTGRVAPAKSRVSGGSSYLDLPEGHVFAQRYLIDNKIHQRETAVIYKATDQILDAPVALKILSRKVFDDARSVERFKRGIVLARKINHPGVCRILDVGQTEETIYVSMDFVKGKSLKDLMAQHGAMAWQSVLRTVKQLLLAVEEMHRLGVIHRHLKPENLVMNTRNKIVIVDFANSASMQVARVTRQGEVVGSADYMAPEQLLSSDIDARADIYAVGVLMFELLTGRLPYEADSPAALVLVRMKSDPRSPSSLVPDLPAELERIILKCLQRQVDQRYQSAREVLNDLEAFESSNAAKA